MKQLKHPAVLFSIYLALVGGSYLPYFAILPIRVSYHLIATGILIWWIWSDGLPSTPLLLPMAATGVITFISALNAIDSRIALENWWHWLINGLLLLMLVSWQRKGYGEKLFNAHFGIGGVIVAISLLQWLLYPGQRVNGPFGLISLTGAYAAALLIPVFIWAWTERRMWLYLVGAGLVAVLIMNDSRGAFASAGMALVVFLLLRYRVKLPVLLTAGAIMILLAFGLVNRSAVEGHALGDNIRLDAWKSALEMVLTHPATGVGPGLFGQAYRMSRSVEDDRILDAHNGYLNLLAELGIPGAVASGLTGFIFLRSLARRRTAKQDAILAALAGIAVHLLFDNFSVVNFTFLINLYAAYLISEKQMNLKPALKVAAARALTGVLLLYGFSLLAMDSAQFYYERSLSNRSWADAMTAATVDPNNRLYQIQVARLVGDETRVHQLDPTLLPTTRLDVYGIISFGRILW